MKLFFIGLLCSFIIYLLDSCQFVFPKTLIIPIRTFTHSGYFYSASSSPLLLKGANDTARILRRSFTPKRHRQLWVKDLPKVPTWRLERDSNPRPFGRKASILPMSHHVPHLYVPRMVEITVSSCLPSRLDSSLVCINMSCLDRPYSCLGKFPFQCSFHLSSFYLAKHSFITPASISNCECVICARWLL